jgi:glycosyltransferase involved in cell wall biosynthesis
VDQTEGTHAECTFLRRSSDRYSDAALPPAGHIASARTAKAWKPVKIGIMLRSLGDVGGPGEYARNMLDALLRLDHENQYYLFLHSQSFVARFRNLPNVHPIVLATRQRLLFDQVLIPIAVRKNGCDVIINLKHSLPLLVGARTVFVMHGADWLAYPQNSYLLDRLYHKVALPWFCRKADKIISVSRNATDIAVKHLGLPRSKVATIYHGFRHDFHRISDPEVLKGVRVKYKLPERFILYVGRIYPMKNVGGLINAFAKLRNRVSHNLVIAGMKYFKAEKDLAAIGSNQLADRVNLLGFVEETDLPAVYSLADVFLLPSLYEGFGIPLLEAMACGCPIVTSTAGSCPEVVGDAAVLVNPCDSEDIAAGVFKVLSDGKLAANLVVKGFSRVTQFSWEKCAQETLDVIRSVVQAE